MAHLNSTGVTLSSFTYRLDDAGLRVGVLEATGDVVTWTYDAADQLRREERDGPNAYDVTHIYDPTGNRTLKLADSLPTSFAYDNANRLRFSEDGAGRTTFTYDAAGNQALQEKPSGDITTSLWDSENKNTAIQLPTSDSVTFTYTADGDRLSKATDTDTRQFLFDASNVVLETDEFADVQAVYTLEPQEYGRLISQEQLEGALWTPFYFHFDALGSTSILTDSVQVTTDDYTYDAYGKLRASSGTTPNRYTWVGELGYARDPETEEYDLRARRYQPDQARFKSEDPLGDDPGANRYRYVENSPVSQVDPSGNEIWWGKQNRESDAFFKNFQEWWEDAKARDKSNLDPDTFQPNPPPTLYPQGSTDRFPDPPNALDAKNQGTIDGIPYVRTTEFLPHGISLPDELKDKKPPFPPGKYFDKTSGSWFVVDQKGRLTTYVPLTWVADQRLELANWPKVSAQDPKYAEREDRVHALPPLPEHPNEPEEIQRNLLIARIRGDEEEIKYWEKVRDDRFRGKMVDLMHACAGGASARGSGPVVRRSRPPTRAVAEAPRELSQPVLKPPPPPDKMPPSKLGPTGTVPPRPRPKPAPPAPPVPRPTPTSKSLPPNVGPKSRVPNKGTSDYHQLVNKENRIRNELAAGGNRGISGTVNSAEADFLGERFVGEGYKESLGPSGERILVSKDGLRQYRGPTAKRSTKATTGTQANFQSRDLPSGGWGNNVHINID